MDKAKYILSRKVGISISRNLQSLIDLSYTEQNVKELLIDLREISKTIVKSKPKVGLKRNENIEQQIEEFIDICNCIAHPNRNISGLLEKKIRSHIDRITTAYINEGISGFAKLAKNHKIITDESLVNVMLASIYLYISKFEDSISIDQLEAINKDKANIGLCIISLLQDTIIKLDKNQGFAILHIIDYEGLYRLYCRIILKDARDRFGTERIMLEFPLIVTNARNIDNLQFPDHNKEAWVSKEFSYAIRDSPDSPAIVETFRGNDKDLHVRFIDI